MALLPACYYIGIVDSACKNELYWRIGIVSIIIIIGIVIAFKKGMVDLFE
jgi:hypothetical protein